MFHRRNLLLNDDSSLVHRHRCHTDTTDNSLWEIFRLEVNSASGHAQPLQLAPLLSSPTDFREETHRHLTVTDHLASEHVSVSDFDVDHVMHARDLKIKALHSPDRVSTATFNNGRSFLTIVDSHGDEGRHSIKEAPVAVLEICFLKVELKFAEQGSDHGWIHDRLYHWLHHRLLLANIWVQRRWLLDNCLLNHWLLLCLVIWIPRIHLLLLHCWLALHWGLLLNDSDSTRDLLDILNVQALEHILDLSVTSHCDTHAANISIQDG